MKTSTATVSIAGDLGEKLTAIAKAGFDGIEIFEQDFISFDLSPADVRRMAADHGLEITLFQPFRDFEGLPEGPLRQRAFSRARHKFDLMCELGTDLMLVCSSVHPAGLGGIDRCADDFRELGEIANSYGVRVGYEALAWGRFINDHRDAWEVVRRADHENVGLILDSFHTLGRKLDPDSIRTIPGDRIFFVQLADAPAIEMDLRRRPQPHEAHGARRPPSLRARTPTRHRVGGGGEGPRRLCCCDCPSAGCCDRGAVRPVARFVRAAESSELGDGRRVPRCRCRRCD